MTTEEDRTAGSNYLTGRLVDLARAAHWARLMKEEQAFLNEAMDRTLKNFTGPNSDQALTADQAVAALREEAVSDYMMGVPEDADDPAEASFAVERENEVFEQLGWIAGRASQVRSYADQAAYLMAPPVWSKCDPWDSKKSPDTDKPDSLKGDPTYRHHLEPSVHESMVYLPALGDSDEHVQVGTLTGFHSQGITVTVAAPGDVQHAQLSFEDAAKLVEQVQQLIRFHKATDSNQEGH